MCMKWFGVSDVETSMMHIYEKMAKWNWYHMLAGLSQMMPT